jgi:Putative prokaryotic signal transducing protein
MEEQTELVKVFTGTEITVGLLKSELEKAGIVGLVQDDFNSAIGSGFFSGNPSTIDLYIRQADLKRASPIIKGFLEINRE